MRRLFPFVVALSALGFVYAISGAAPGVGGAEPATSEKRCPRGLVHAVIAGRHRCLKRGQPCVRRHDRQYHRYGFHCHTGRLTPRKQALPKPPPPPPPAAPPPPAPPPPAPPPPAPPPPAPPPPAPPPPPSGGPLPYRYIFNSGSDQAGAAANGWNLLDVSYKAEADALPAGTQGLVWVGDYDNTSCSWEVSDASLRTKVQGMVGDPKVAGYFFANESDPYGCPNAVADHKARNALIKSIDPAKFTIITVDSNSGQQSLDQIPLWKGVADYIDYNPYICYQGKACDFGWLDTIIEAADAVGTPYFIALQAFTDSTWRWPTAAEEQQMLDRLSMSNASGYMTFAWTWAGNYLTSQPGLLGVLKRFNEGSPPDGGDTIPPTTPGGLSGSGATETSVSLSWTAATDNVGVAGYGIYSDATLVATSTQTSYTLSGLSCGTSYTLAVDAYDAAGNRSARASQAVQTAACAPLPPPSDPVVAAAGDIAASAADSAGTALLLDQIAPDRVLTLGDNAYPDGSPSQFMSYYDPNWGRFKAKTSPAPGNHDYHLAGASGYFGYFGALAPAEYYSYDLGSWHLISLNSEIGVSSSSAQLNWLRNDLAAHPNQCTLAYWHKPRFSSGSTHGGSSSFNSFWQALHAANADVVLVGHEHNYERFAGQSPGGAADPNGIQQFVVGTGGAGHYGFGTPVANSQVRNSTSFGVLKLTLHASSYDWQFVPEAGASFTDSGSMACH